MRGIVVAERNDAGRNLQSVFTVVAPVRPEAVLELQGVLGEIAADPSGNEILPLGQLPGLHYASLVLFPERSGREPLLMFESNVDGPITDHLRRLVEVGGVGIDRLWGTCPEYPPGGVVSGDVGEWLRARVVLPGAYHLGATGRSRAQIEDEARLRAAIEDHIDAMQAAGTLPASAHEIHEAVKAHVAARPELAWVLRPAPSPTATERIAWLAHVARSSDRSLMGPVGIGLIAFIGLAKRSPGRAVFALLAGGGLAAGWLRWRESSDPCEDLPVPDELFDAIEHIEDRPGAVANHLASLVDLKPGIGRRTALRAILLVIDLAARAVYTKGELGGIPSIHFAHWSMISGGRRLLFVSNYDGSWESYLDDFIEKAASGLTAVWSNTVNFPTCRWLGIPVGSGGARHGPAFKRIARNSQAPTTVHFAAYPTLSVSNIHDNTELRLGLARDLDERKAQAWLSRL